MRVSYKDSTHATINLLLLLASNMVWAQHGYGAQWVRIASDMGTEPQGYKASRVRTASNMGTEPQGYK